MFTQGGVESQSEHGRGGLFTHEELANDPIPGSSPKQRTSSVGGFQPRRREREWVPAPLLCKRFDVPKPDKARQQQRQEQETVSKPTAYKVDQLSLGGTDESSPTFQHCVSHFRSDHAEQNRGASYEDGGADTRQDPETDSRRVARPTDERKGLRHDRKPGDPLDAAPEEALQPEPAAEKPLDLYKAIFDDDSDEEQTTPF